MLGLGLLTVDPAARAGRQVDLVIEAGLQSYDIAGPLAVVRAAGGIVA